MFTKEKEGIVPAWRASGGAEGHYPVMVSSIICPAVHILGSTNMYNRAEGIADYYWPWAVFLGLRAGRAIEPARRAIEIVGKAVETAGRAMKLPESASEPAG